MSRYEEAGVNIKKGEEAVERIKAHLRSTFVPGVVGDVWPATIVQAWIVCRNVS